MERLGIVMERLGECWKYPKARNCVGVPFQHLSSTFPAPAQVLEKAMNEGAGRARTCAGKTRAG